MQLIILTRSLQISSTNSSSILVSTTETNSLLIKINSTSSNTNSRFSRNTIKRLPSRAAEPAEAAGKGLLTSW